jgi:hypothetical protein
MWPQLVTGEVGTGTIQEILAPPAADVAALFTDEMERATTRGDEVWWPARGSAWLEDMFAFWMTTTEAPPAHNVEIRYSNAILDERRFPAMQGRCGPVEQPERRKAALTLASGLQSDAHLVLECARHYWEFSRCVEQSFDEFRVQHPTVSAFGVDGWDPWPANLGVHAIMETLDGWMLLGLRSKRGVAHSQLTWSASFEETVEAGKPRDGSVEATILRGLKQEFGLPARTTNLRAEVLAIGRECSQQPDGGRPMGSVVIVRVQLGVTLEELWKSLSHHHRARDVIEHDDWMALRLTSRYNDILQLISATEPRTRSGIGPRLFERLGVQYDLFEPPVRTHTRPDGFGWHPTSRARLLLWAMASVD